MVIAAHFDKSPDTAGKARDPRRMLRLEARGLTASGDSARVLVHNISASGLLLESDATLAQDERIDVDLPQVGTMSARVIWASGTYYGCQFDAAISSAVLSAAQLRSEAPSGATVDARVPAGGSFGARLQRFRKERGLTQSALADQLGVSKPTVWAWEQGKARPVEARMEALAQALDVPAAELLLESDSGFLNDLIARAKGQIAGALGVSSDKIRIVIDL
jgi:transcriptional regulator with XRE-family HTH domain